MHKDNDHVLFTFKNDVGFKVGRRALGAGMVLLLAIQAALVQAESEAATEPGSPVDHLSMPLRAKRKRGAMIQNQPYAPIKKRDDQAEIPEIEMFVGESRVFPTPGVGRIAVGNGQVMSAAALDNKEVIVFANAVGTSSLFVWNEDGRYQRVKVNVVPGDTTRFAREIATFLAAIPNAKASVIGDKVIVEGDNLTDQDIAKIDELAKRYPQIVNFTNRLGWEQMVLMDVKVVEFPTNKLRDIGLKWNAVGGAAIGAIWSPARFGQMPYQLNIQAGGQPIGSAEPSSTVTPLSSSLNVLSGLNLGLNAQLNLLAQDGTASILAQPQLSARNGAKASFLAGGEYPYTVTTLAGPTVSFKPYGVKLDITPRVDRNGVVRAVIESEVSSIDASLSTPSGPAIRTRRTNTEFNVKNGETIVLSGLLQRDASTSIDKVPLLGDIPVLGALFRSRRYQNNETELVVFVTPTVVNSHTPELAERVERTTERLRQEYGKPPYLNVPLSGAGSGQARESVVNRAAPQPAAVLPAPFKPALPGPAKTIDSVPLLPKAQNPLASKAVTASNTAAALPGKRYRVGLEQLALRATPDGNAPVVKPLEQDMLVEALPQAPSGHWIAVQADGKRGWAAVQWLIPESAEEAERAAN